MPKHIYEIINKSWHNLTLYTVNNIAILHRGFMCRIALRKKDLENKHRTDIVTAIQKPVEIAL